MSSKYIDHRCKVNKKNSDDNIPESVVQFLDYLMTIKAKSNTTINAYRSDLSLFFRFIVHKKKPTVDIDNVNISKIDIKIIKNIKLSDLHAFLSYCQKDRENGENARARKVATLKSYFNYLEDITEIIIKNPTKKLESPKIPDRQPIYLTLEESKQVLMSLDKTDRNYYRDNCIFVVLLNTGIRISELIGIKLTDIREGILTVIGKGDKERDIPLNNACIKAIYNYLENRDKNEFTREQNEYLIILGKQGIENMVKNYIEKAGITNGEIYTPHKLRHTSATLMYKYGKTDIVQLKDLLGHKNLSTTQIYTHVDSDDLKKAVNNNPLADF